MPQLLVAAITPYVASALFALTASTAFVVAATGIVAGALAYGALALGAYLLQGALTGGTQQQQRPETPKPEDGKYNLKQSVPPLVYVLGQVKKAGDYAFLEETGGTAYHVMVWAAHHIKGFKSHWLHDEEVTLDADGFVTGPASFQSKVRIYTRLGLSASTAYAHIVAAFPSIWGATYRGDGLATVAMTVQSVAAENLQKVFPNGMPQHQAIGEGHDELIDPRTGEPGYSTNLAIFRHWHLAHPVGGKLALEDLYTPDWAAAADVCDQTVFNRDGGAEKRYHGGMWFRANSDPVQVGRTMDHAGELVIYERPDGKVGVHAGAYVEPNVRLVANDLVSVSYDPNKRRSSTVLAVRGRFTDPAKGYNTADAAIYGLPYPSDDERTKTVENVAVQSHNHIARMQKLASLRANAPRVRLVAHYEPARQVPYRRFVRIHYPPKLVDAVIEITGRPTLSLRNLTYEFEGIVVPPTLYDFNAVTEEGEPSANPVPVERQDVPVPTGFSVSIQQEDVGGGSTAAYALAEFDFQNSNFQYELEWQPTAGGAAQQVLGNAGSVEVRSVYLADGVQYRFRARTWSVGTPSDWTGYQVLTATADPVAPGAVSAVSGVGGAGQVTFNWTAPNSSNYVGARLYLNGTNSMTGATLVGTEYGAANAADTRTINGISAGTAFGFVVAINGSGIAAAPVGTGSLTIT